MTTYYVGVGGNDGNSGLTWALRKLTLNGAEDVPVVANDDVYVGPGAYRESLTLDVSGSAGNPITYIADVTGENTDQIGGVVRITGSDNDTATARSQCIEATAARDYRTFRGFHMDMGSSRIIKANGNCENWIIEDCCFYSMADDGIEMTTGATADFIIRRCMFVGVGTGNRMIYIENGATVTGNHLIENCVFLGASRASSAVWVNRIDGGTIRNCLFLGCYIGADMNNLAVATQWDVENCIFESCYQALNASVLGEIVEDYNTFWENGTDRVNTNVGGNSQAYPSLLSMPILHAGASQVSGFKFSWWFGELSKWSQLTLAGSNEPAVDLYGNPRPVTASKNSWGPLQFIDSELESGTVQAGTYARAINDAGSKFVRRIPVTGVEITVSLYLRREANYAGNLPQMIIKQPGQADQTSTMVAAVNTWEQLSDTFTPSATPGFVDVYAVSRNTAVAGNYVTFYDTMDVS